MTGYRLATALCAMVLAGASDAEPSAQSIAQLRIGLASVGIEADLSKLTLDQEVALHLELSSPEDEPGDNMISRYNLIKILERNPATEPTRK